ncbi:FecR family protein [Steroidobacter sp.]|uniref:FecR family protein n=1 Tax=Steroidobacter sp. TaxID=1978227 RepID=UPI001A643085|nr:FecR domain-containing protein [Steroidobacter sp.]MBL8270909.1 FecR domain-containing protein [Steroidobacter sp.]
MDVRQINEDAASWLIRLETEPTAGCKAEFSAWLAQSPLHVQNFLLVSAAYRELDGLKEANSIDVEQLIGEWTAEEAGNVVAMNASVAAATTLPLASTSEKVTTRASKWTALRFAAGIAAVALVGWQIAGTLLTPRYTTAIGEQRTIKLQDASRIEMNVRSRIEVDLSAANRDIRLLDGEALFSVEHDPSRPFRVITDYAVVQAIGTEFNVYRREGMTTVAVVGGVVRITPTKGTAQTLAAGQVADIRNDGSVVRHPPDEVARQTAWRQRKLDFRGASLSDVAAEFNRFNRVQIQIGDPEIAQRELNGVFNADEPQALLNFLRNDRDVRVEDSGEQVTIRRR